MSPSQPRVDQIELFHVTIIRLLHDLEPFKLLCHILLNISTVIRNKVQRHRLIKHLTLDDNTIHTELRRDVLDEVLEDGEIRSLCIDFQYSNTRDVTRPHKPAQPHATDPHATLREVHACMQARFKKRFASFAALLMHSILIGDVVVLVAQIERAAPAGAVVHEERQRPVVVVDVRDDKRVPLVPLLHERFVERVERDQFIGARFDRLSERADVDVDEHRRWPGCGGGRLRRVVVVVDEVGKGDAEFVCLAVDPLLYDGEARVEITPHVAQHVATVVRHEPARDGFVHALAHDRDPCNCNRGSIGDKVLEDGKVRSLCVDDKVPYACDALLSNERAKTLTMHDRRAQRCVRAVAELGLEKVLSGGTALVAM